MFFWNSLAFSMIQQMLAICSLVPLPFLNPAWTSGSSQFMYYWSLSWRILISTLLTWEMSVIVQQFGHSLSLPFCRIGKKTDLFQFCSHCLVFQFCWHISSSQVYDLKDCSLSFIPSHGILERKSFHLMRSSLSTLLSWLPFMSFGVKPKIFL